MKKFDIVKTVQLVVLCVLAVATLYVVVSDGELYQAIANNAHVRTLCAILWTVLASSFVFMLYDFSSYATLRRENSELDYAVYADQLTGIANRYSCDAHIAQYGDAPVSGRMACVTMDLTCLRRINELKGHAGGDEAIREFSLLLARVSEGTCFVGRNGGNKFLCIFDNTDRSQLDSYIEGVAAAVEGYNQTAGDARLEYVTGVALASEEEGEHTLPELVAFSDRRATHKERA